MAITGLTVPVVVPGVGRVSGVTGLVWSLS